MHVVKGTRLANDWRRGNYAPWTQQDYVETAADLVERTPENVVYHRLTGTASPQGLLAPDWCARKWRVIDAIAETLVRSNSLDVVVVDFAVVGAAEQAEAIHDLLRLPMRAGHVSGLGRIRQRQAARGEGSGEIGHRPTLAVPAVRPAWPAR